MYIFLYLYLIDVGSISSTGNEDERSTLVFRVFRFVSISDGNSGDFGYWHPSSSNISKLFFETSLMIIMNNLVIEKQKGMLRFVLRINQRRNLRIIIFLYPRSHMFERSRKFLHRLMVRHFFSRT